MLIGTVKGEYRKMCMRGLNIVSFELHFEFGKGPGLEQTERPSAKGAAHVRA